MGFSTRTLSVPCMLMVMLLCRESTAFAPSVSRQPSFLVGVPHHRPRSDVATRHPPAGTGPLRKPHETHGISRASSSSSLAMVAAAPAAGVAAITGAISGGLFSGSLHAIAGPDHLAALLPRCCGQRWYRAGRIGALWGMGHGLSATIIGIVAFGLKNRMKNLTSFSGVLSRASFATEIAVGLSLVVIGLMGIREAREWEDEMMEGPVPAHSLSAAAADSGIKTAQKRAVIFNGLLHGFSWDGAPSLAPALALATWRGNFAFLLAYAAGTMAAMALTTTLIGEGTRRAGEFFRRPDIPQKLSMGSSILAIAIGVVWVGLALR